MTSHVDIISTYLQLFEPDGKPLQRALKIKAPSWDVTSYIFGHNIECIYKLARSIPEVSDYVISTERLDPYEPVTLEVIRRYLSLDLKMFYWRLGALCTEHFRIASFHPTKFTLVGRTIRDQWRYNFSEGLTYEGFLTVLKVHFDLSEETRMKLRVSEIRVSSVARPKI